MIELLSCIFVFCIMVMEGLGLVDQWRTNRFQRAYWAERTDFYARRLQGSSGKPSKKSQKGQQGNSPAGTVESPKSLEGASGRPELVGGVSGFEQLPSGGNMPPQVVSRLLAALPQETLPENDKLPLQQPPAPAPDNPAVD